MSLSRWPRCWEDDNFCQLVVVTLSHRIPRHELGLLSISSFSSVTVMRIGKVLAVAGTRESLGQGRKGCTGPQLGLKWPGGVRQGGRWGEHVWVSFPSVLAILHLSLWAPVLCPQKLPFMGYCFSLFVQFLGGLSQCEAPSGDKRVRPEIKSSFPVPSPPGTLGSVVLPPKGHGS